MKTDANAFEPELDGEVGGEMSEAEIDDNLEDTFPASDPPSWTLGSDHHPSTNQEHEDDGE